MTKDETDDKKITSGEAHARIKDGEELLFTECPHCQNLLAIYILHKAIAAKDLN